MAEAFVSSWSMSLFQQMARADRGQVVDGVGGGYERHQGTTGKSHTGQCAQTPKSSM
jgi:hypothetical protein